MLSRRKILPVALTAIGLFLITVGGDSLKLGHLEYFPTLSFTTPALFSYQTISIGVLTLGFMLLVVAAEMCRRADNRGLATVPGIPPSSSFPGVRLPAALIAVLAWTILNSCVSR